MVPDFQTKSLRKGRISISVLVDHAWEMHIYWKIEETRIRMAIAEGDLVAPFFQSISGDSTAPNTVAI